LIGLTIAAAWGAWEIFRTNARAQVIAAVLFIACALLCLQATARQLRYWQSSISLFEHALAVTSDNWIAHSNLSHALLNKNDDAEAAAYHADKAVRIRPTDPAPHVNLGIALLRLKRTSEARGEFETALRIEPNWPDAHQDLGGALMLDGKVDEAIPHFYTALRYDPDHLPSLKALGWIRSTRSDARWRNADEALRCAKRAVELTNRKDAEALDVLAAALAEAGRFSEAIATDEEARTLALIGKQAALANEITERLELYHLGLPYRTHP
jgi:protein O-mannosyl-transferase